LEDIRPRARVYVVNIDGFFDARPSPPTAAILSGQSTASSYRRKRLWQYPHSAICGVVPVLCGTELAFFRDRRTGAWNLSGTNNLTPSDVGEADDGGT